MWINLIGSCLVPFCVVGVLTIIERTKKKHSKRMTDDKFVVSPPLIASTIGILLMIVLTVVILIQTFLQEEIPHYSFYIIFSLFEWMAVCLIVMPYFKVVVKGNEITVYPIIRKSYSCTFDDIVSVKRYGNPEVSNAGERLVIKISSGKKFAIESPYISYNRFEKKLIEKGIPIEQKSNW